jgi:hypothetical protein
MDNSSGLNLDGSKATFGFVAKLRDGSSSGQLEFQYKTDSINLKSTSYDWVTVSTTQAIFEGLPPFLPPCHPLGVWQWLADESRPPAMAA